MKPTSGLAWAALVKGGMISVQVLNEFAAAARRRLNKSWEEVRRAFGIEPIEDIARCHPPVLKITQGVPTRSENSLLITRSARVYRNPVLTRFDQTWSVMNVELSRFITS